MRSDRRFRELFEPTANEKIYEDKVVQSSVSMSYVACASATSELLKYLSTDLEVIVALTELWNVLQDGSLLGKAIWNIRAKDFFPLI